MRHVERARPHARPEDGDRVYPPPQFIVPLKDVTQSEGGKIHFEGRIEPVGDPTMYVEWFLNGRPLTASKYSTPCARCTLHTYVIQNGSLLLTNKIRRKNVFYSGTTVNHLLMMLMNFPCISKKKKKIVSKIHLCYVFRSFQFIFNQ